MGFTCVTMKSDLEPPAMQIGFKWPSVSENTGSLILEPLRPPNWSLSLRPQTKTFMFNGSRLLLKLSNLLKNDSKSIRWNKSVIIYAEQLTWIVHQLNYPVHRILLNQRPRKTCCWKINRHRFSFFRQFAIRELYNLCHRFDIA